MGHAIEREIDRNFDFFERHISDFIEGNKGKFALLRKSKVVAFHDTIAGAEKAGVSEFQDGVFSIQEVTDEPVDLGFFTHAYDTRES